MEDKNNQKDKGCPLCRVGEESLKRLKESKKPSKELKKKKKKKPKLLRIFIIAVVVAGVALGLALFYSGNNSNQEIVFEEQKTEEQEVVEEEIIPEDEQDNQEPSAEKTNPEAVYAPDFSFKDAEGNEISLSSLRGNNILLVFWATWCGYCQKELPDLKNFVEKYGDRILVLTFVNQEPKEVVQKYAEQEKLNFPILIDETGQIWQAYLVRGTPSHFLIDKEGKIIASWPGYASKEVLENMASLFIQQ